MIGILVAACAAVSTGVGGLVALRIRDRLHLLLGFSAGAVLGVVFFDILPELVHQTRAQHISFQAVSTVAAVGFFTFFLLERATALHAAGQHEHKTGTQHTGEVGVLAAAGLSVHSFLDGVGIAVGFSAGTTLGLAIGLAVLVHDFSDGLNTVTVVLAHGNPLKRAFGWLTVDALTPLAGAIAATAAGLPPTVLPYLLASYCGFFLYISASDLLPEAREHNSASPVATALLGAVTLFVATRFI